MAVRHVLASLTIAVPAATSVLLLCLSATATIAVALDKSSVDPALLVRGAQLAAIGNCGSCHTRREGKPYAGGRAMETPFGTIYSTNITPDTATGIGNWSEADFLRAMHEGIAPGGRHLYPAFPYDHFTKVTEDDVKAIYAFVMTRDPVNAETPPNKLTFPFNIRPFLAAWKALFLKHGVYQPDTSKSEEWNRGAYLVQGLGHCGACHTPHSALGAEDRRNPLGGGDAESWHAPAMNADSPAPVPWTAEQLFNYLRRGDDDVHGIAVGPMTHVIHNLSQVAEADVRAIAHYIATTMTPEGGTPRMTEAAAVGDRERRATTVSNTATDQPSSATPLASGAAIFAGACATCHDPGAAAPSVKTVPLAQTTSINAPDPRNVIHIVLDGIWPQSGEAGPLMPGFGAELTGQQTTMLIEYLRSRFTARPVWNDIPEKLRSIAARSDTP